MRHSTDLVPVPTVGQRIQELRLEQGLTQQELANTLESLGWTKPSEILVYKVQTGIRRLDYHELAIFARALKCSIPELFAVPTQGNSRKRARSS